VNAAKAFVPSSGMTKLAAILLALAACGKSSPTCDAMADRLGKHFAEVAGADARKDLVKACTEAKWSGDLRGCMADATDEKSMSQCVSQFPMGTEMHGDSKGKIAKLTVMKYADEAFPQWSMAHPDKACPDKLDDLNEYMNNADIKDPWGNPYKLMCGQNLPPGAKHLAVLSFGPDGHEGTADDIKSWE
jgi:hypothetical protein